MSIIWRNKKIETIIGYNSITKYSYFTLIGVLDPTEEKDDAS